MQYAALCEDTRPEEQRMQFVDASSAACHPVGHPVQASYAKDMDMHGCGDRKVKNEFKKLSAIMALSVGMAYLVKDGKVQWREQFTRGESPMNQFEGQLKRLVAGEAVELKNGTEPEEEESDDDDDEEGGTVNVAISAAGADY
eukprot:g1292.t1